MSKENKENTEPQGPSGIKSSGLLCPECNHALEYHSQYGCTGAFPNGTENVSPEEVFYGECHCHYNPKNKLDDLGNNDTQWDNIKYDNPPDGCPNCGRHRVELCCNNKHRCEKCGWVIEDEIYVGLDIGR